jgi:segregation and condensation protein A
MSYKVKLQAFEGPFDLLVYLIESAKMSIYDIQVSEITAQYIEYVEQMQEMDVDLSSDFMVLAAELIELKSKMLLPRHAGDDETVRDEDPRDELVARILEYKKYKAISAFLKDQEDGSRRKREKPQEDISKYLDNPDEILSMDMAQFVKAFDAFLRRKRKLEEIQQKYRRIERERITTEARMDFIKSLFREDSSRTVNFKDTLQFTDDRYDKAVSFSSMLEMINQDKLTAEQRALFADILIRAGENLFREVE